MEKLPGDYIAGFVDGEGCFALKFRKDIKPDRENSPFYFYWDIEFAICLKGDDKEILEKIRVFEKHPLYAKKRFDFELWKEAVDIFKRNQRIKVNTEKGKDGFQKTKWDPVAIQRLKEIHEEMKKYKGGNRGNWKWL